MKKTLLTTFVLAATVLATACRSSTMVEVFEIEGTWFATSARFVEIAAPKRNNVDLIELGMRVTFVADAAGVFTLTLHDLEAPDETVTGTIDIDGTDVTVSGNSIGTGDIFLEDDQLAFRLTAGLEFDFSGEGEPLPARLVLVLERTE